MANSFTTALACATVLTLVIAPAGAEVTTITPERLDRLPVDLLADIQYAQNDHGFGRDELYLDLPRPVTDDPTPVIVFVLGSGWSPVEAERVPPQLTRLAEAGFAMASVDYRGIGEVTFPTPRENVKRAIRFLRQNADAYNIDPNAIGILGNSAGGHIALLVCLSDEDAFRDDGAASQDAGALVQAIGAIYVDEMAGNPLGAVNQHFGLLAGDEASADAFASGLPDTHIDAEDPPVLLIHGTADVVVPIEQSERFDDAFDAAGVDVTLLRVKGLGHSIEDTMTPGRSREA